MMVRSLMICAVLLLFISQSEDTFFERELLLEQDGKTVKVIVEDEVAKTLKEDSVGKTLTIGPLKYVRHASISTDVVNGQNFSVYEFKGVFLSHLKGRTRIRALIAPTAANATDSDQQSAQAAKINPETVDLTAAPAESASVDPQELKPDLSQATPSDAPKAIKIENDPFAKKGRKKL